MVGAWNAFFSLLVFWVLLTLFAGVAAAHHIALTLSTIVNVLQSHYSQRRIVWRSSQPYAPELRRFACLQFSLVVVNYFILSIGVDVFGFSPIFIQAVAVAIVVILSFIGSRNRVFSRVPA